MDVIFVNKQNLKSRSATISSNVVPVAFVSCLTIASVGYSAFSDNNYGGQSANYVTSYTTTARTSTYTTRNNTSTSYQRNNSKQLAMRVNELQAQAVQLNKRGRQLVNKSKADFSLSWEPIISKNQRGTTQKSRYTSYSRSQTPQRRFNRFSPRPIHDFKRSIKTLTVSKNLLQRYTSRVQSLPGGWPLEHGRVSSGYGWRGRRMHRGVDLAASTGTPIFAVEEGIVMRSKYVRGYGRLVEIKHGELYTTRYGHNSRNLVNTGDRVRKGQIIALVGSTGRSTGPHVHFEVRQAGVAINPVKYLGAMENFRLSENISLSKYVLLSKK
ncbi:Peptidase M23B [Beggiatoa sp. PS]|nr:Peptidase M23B [Beggiatoa sp. PS]